MKTALIKIIVVVIGTLLLTWIQNLVGIKIEGSFISRTAYAFFAYLVGIVIFVAK